jgi:hypothetical protein
MILPSDVGSTGAGQKGLDMSRYKTLRMWSTFLMVLGVVSMISTAFGVASLAIAVDGFWDTMGVIFLGAPVALLFASWPFAAGTGLRALADIGDAVVLDIDGPVIR